MSLAVCDGRVVIRQIPVLRPMATGFMARCCWLSRCRPGLFGRPKAYRMPVSSSSLLILWPTRSRTQVADAPRAVFWATAQGISNAKGDDILGNWSRNHSSRSTGLGRLAPCLFFHTIQLRKWPPRHRLASDVGHPPPWLYLHRTKKPLGSPRLTPMTQTSAVREALDVLDDAPLARRRPLTMVVHVSLGPMRAVLVFLFPGSSGVSSATGVLARFAMASANGSRTGNLPTQSAIVERSRSTPSRA